MDEFFSIYRLTLDGSRSYEKAFEIAFKAVNKYCDQNSYSCKKDIYEGLSGEKDDWIWIRSPKYYTALMFHEFKVDANLALMKISISNEDRYEMREKEFRTITKKIGTSLRCGKYIAAKDDEQKDQERFAKSITISWEADISEDFRKNKDAYLNLAMIYDKLESIGELYSKFGAAYGDRMFAQRKAEIAAVQYTIANHDKQSANSALKINPFIIGGAVDGLVGPAAGIVAAGEASKRNDQIDAARSKANKDYIQYGASFNIAKTSLSVCDAEVAKWSEKLFSEYMQIPRFRELRLEGKEQKYKGAKSFMQSGQYDIAIKAFTECQGYKDSDKLKEECIESRKSTGGCYVATCVYGSYDCPQVWTLRRFRDYELAQNKWGRAFIKIYYAISPKVVKEFGNNELFKSLWRRRLDKLVRDCKNKGYSDSPYKDKTWQ